MIYGPDGKPTRSLGEQHGKMLAERIMNRNSDPLRIFEFYQQFREALAPRLYDAEGNQIERMSIAEIRERDFRVPINVKENAG